MKKEKTSFFKKKDPNKKEINKKESTAPVHLQAVHSPIISIFCCCASGLGSSLMLKMTVEEALEIVGLKNYELSFGQASAIPMMATLILCSDELAPNLHVSQDVRGLHDLMDENEAAKVIQSWLKERDR